MRQLAQAWPKSVGGLSLREWIRDDSDEKPILLLQASKAFPTVSDTYICAVLNVLIKLILSPILSTHQHDESILFWMKLHKFHISSSLKIWPHWVDQKALAFG